MKFIEDDSTDGPRVAAYGPEGILIGGRRYREGIILTPRRVLPGWGPAAAGALAAEHLAALLARFAADRPAGALRILILGTGRRQIFPPPALLSDILARGIGIEIMDTGAACRTCNILLAEGRDLVAGLLPCDG